jgi:hypothetical protein
MSALYSQTVAAPIITGTPQPLYVKTNDITRLTIDGASGAAVFSANLDAPTISVVTLTVSGDSSFTSTGAIKIPVGTSAQQPAGAAGKIRYNSTVGKYEGHNGTSWGQLGGGATGGGSDTVFMLNGQIVTTDYTVPAGYNAVSAGPVDITDGAIVTIGDTEFWTIV